MNQIIKSISRENRDQWINNYSDLYLSDDQKYFKQYKDSIHITDLKNAMKKGMICISYTIRFSSFRSDDVALINVIESNISDLWNLLESLTFTQNKYGSQDDLNVMINGLEFSIYKSFHKSIRVFSPFNLSELKPLAAAPTKFTMAHVYRMLANNQFSGLRCTGHYTDDYAFDAAVDYQRSKSDITDGSILLCDISENPSGWHVYISDDKIHINCHSFLGYSCSLKLS